MTSAASQTTSAAHAQLASASRTGPLGVEGVAFATPKGQRPQGGSSANSSPFTTASEQPDVVDEVYAAYEPRPEFDPRGWAVHILMLGDRTLQVGAAKALAKQQLRAQARSLREKAYRARKNANSVCPEVAA